jgi:hypothetical protein
MANLSKHGSGVLSSVLALVGVRHEERAETEATFVGVWLVQDSNGKSFEIALHESGDAEASRDGEGMNGTWESDGRSAVVSWDTGWTTKITRTADGYVKTAYDSTAAAPTNTSSAEKIS